MVIESTMIGNKPDAEGGGICQGQRDIRSDSCQGCFQL